MRLTQDDADVAVAARAGAGEITGHSYGWRERTRGRRSTLPAAATRLPAPVNVIDVAKAKARLH
jgi:hypothetical protein